MFIESPDLIEGFANQFVSDTDQNWYFQFREDWPRLPVSESEILVAIERYRRRSMMAMSAVWFTLLAPFLWFCWAAQTGGAHAIGIKHLLAFALAFFLIAFFAPFWAMVSSTLPFYQRLLQYVEDRQRSGSPVGSPNIIVP